MKILSDLSAIIKLAFICMVIGFVLGLCVVGAMQSHEQPTSQVAATVGPDRSRVTGQDPLA